MAHVEDEFARVLYDFRAQPNDGRWPCEKEFIEAAQRKEALSGG